MKRSIQFEIYSRLGKCSTNTVLWSIFLFLLPMITVAQKSDKVEVEQDSELSCITNILLPKKGGPKIRTKGECQELLKHNLGGSYWNYKIVDWDYEDDKKRIIKKIVALDTTINCQIKSSNKSITLAVRKAINYLPENESRGIIKSAIRSAKRWEKKEIAGLSLLLDLKEFAYRAYFNSFRNPTEIDKALKDLRGSVDSLVTSKACLVAIETISDLESFLEYMKAFKDQTQFYELAFEKAMTFIPCDSFPVLIKRYPQYLGGVANRLPENVTVACMENAEDFKQYLLDYEKSKAKHRYWAAKRIRTTLSLNDCELMDLFSNHPQACMEFRGFFLDAGINCIQEKEDCPTINRVYIDDEAIEKVLLRAVKLFGLNELSEIIKQPLYIESRYLLAEAFYKSITSVDDVDIFRDHFPDCSPQLLLKAFLLGIRYAEREGKTKRLLEFLAMYLSHEGGDPAKIQAYLSCNTMLKIADGYQNLREQLHESILRCVGNDTLILEEYLNIYESNTEELMATISSYMQADVAIYLYRKNGGDPGQYIEQIFPQKIANSRHLQWYQEQFPESPYLEKALRKGIAVTKNPLLRNRYLGQYFGNYGFRSDLIQNYLPRGEEDNLTKNNITKFSKSYSIYLIPLLLHQHNYVHHDQLFAIIFS